MFLLIKLRNGFFKVATRLVRLVQSLLGASTVGVRGLAIDENGKVLLVKHTYMPGWHLPGGGVKHGENPKQAVIRELWEETGLKIHGSVDLFGVYYHKVYGVDDYPILYIIKNYIQEQVSSPEIAETGWFHYSNLPQGTTPATYRRIQEYVNSTEKLADW